MEITNRNQERTYLYSESCVFRKTKEAFGGLSNMSSGFPLRVNGINILTSEALYQACRFPHLPEVQEKIILEKSPMSAKMVGKPFRKNSRTDWEDVKIKIMRWCLRLKLAQNFIEFGRILETTGNLAIVEDSSKDIFWGAVQSKSNGNTLTGVNALGRLLMELRSFYNENRYSYDMFVIEPLKIPNFTLYGQVIETIDERDNFISWIKKSTKFEEIENMKPWSPYNSEVKNIESNKFILKEPTIESFKKQRTKKGGIRKENKSTSDKTEKYSYQSKLPF